MRRTGPHTSEAVDDAALMMLRRFGFLSARWELQEFY